jgi:subtilase family serine protease
VGGTSVAAPTFAGIVALLNQYLISNGFQTKPGVGNVNPRLYAMAQSVPSAFHDITTGNNIVNACSNPRGCTVGSVGYSAGPGYDPVTGWGSLDVFNLITGWSQTSTAAKGVAALTLTQLAVPGSLSSAFAATVTASDGGTPTGAVNLIAGGATVATATLASAGSGKSTATLTVVTSKLPAGLSSVSAEYSGDASYGTAAASLDVTVASSTVMFIQGVTNAASYKQAFSSGEIVAVFGNLLAGSTQSAATVPLPTTLGGVSVTVNGVPAPLYFISARSPARHSPRRRPHQVSLWIPRGRPPGRRPRRAARPSRSM